MATLHILYDPESRIQVTHEHLPKETKIAALDVANNMEKQDIYAIARRLAEMLLEQL